MIAIALALLLSASPSTRCSADAAATCEGGACTEIAEACAAQVAATDSEPTSVIRAASVAMTAAGAGGQPKAMKFATESLKRAAAIASKHPDDDTMQAWLDLASETTRVLAGFGSKERPTIIAAFARVESAHRDAAQAEAASIGTMIDAATLALDAVRADSAEALERGDDEVASAKTELSSLRAAGDTVERAALGVHRLLATDETPRRLHRKDARRKQALASLTKAVSDADEMLRKSGKDFCEAHRRADEYFAAAAAPLAPLSKSGNAESAATTAESDYNKALSKALQFVARCARLARGGIEVDAGLALVLPSTRALIGEHQRQQSVFRARRAALKRLGAEMNGVASRVTELNEQLDELRTKARALEWASGAGGRSRGSARKSAGRSTKSWLSEVADTPSLQEPTCIREPTTAAAPAARLERRTPHARDARLASLEPATAGRATPYPDAATSDDPAMGLARDVEDRVNEAITDIELARAELSTTSKRALRVTAMGSTGAAAVARACVELAGGLDAIDPAAANCIGAHKRLLEALRGWENDALGSLAYRSDGSPEPDTQQRYLAIKAARETVEAALADARDALRVAAARCRHDRSTTDSECTLPPEPRLAELLDRQSLGLDAQALRAGTEQLKALGGGAMSSAAQEGLTVLAEVALKRAQRQGLVALQDRLEAAICELRVPKDWLPKALQDLESDLRPFTATCALVRSTSIEDLATDPQRMQPALVADLSDLATQWGLGAIGRLSPTLEDVMPSLRMAIGVAARIRKQQIARPSHADAQALVSDLRRLTCSTANCGGRWTGAAAVVPLAIEAIFEYVERGGRYDAAEVIDVLLRERPGVDPAIRQRAIELTLLGVRAVGLAREPVPGDEHDSWTAALTLAFEIADEAARDSEIARGYLAAVRRLVEAVGDENSTAAVSAASELLARMVEEQAGRRCVGTLGGADRRACKLPDRFVRASQLLAGVSSYAASYSAAGGGATSEAEARAARKAALEGMIDLATRRSGRAGEWVVGLGMPVGFSTGVQFFRERVRTDERDCSSGFTAGGREGLALRAPSSCRPLAMTPQLELPLGFGVQRIVGARQQRAADPSRRRTWAFDGIHIFASVLDPGQFVAYDATGNIARPRWENVFSPGVQVGWAFGKPENQFVLALSTRYAPTLFAGTAKLIRESTPDPGGVLRIGISIAYYVALFDFN